MNRKRFWFHATMIISLIIMSGGYLILKPVMDKVQQNPDFIRSQQAR